MIIDFKVKNFRSFKEEQFFSMRAGVSKNKPDNFFEVKTADGSKLKLLRAAVMYGANASGKTNLIRAFRVFQILIQKSSQFNASDKINYYDPFLLDFGMRNSPTEFFISFLDKEMMKYDYKIIYDNEQILEERLDFYPTSSKSKNLFRRNFEKEVTLDEVILGKAFEDKRVEKKVLPNQLYLSKIGGNIGHQQLTPIYKELVNVTVWNSLKGIDQLIGAVSLKLEGAENLKALKNLSNLIRVADTQIEKVKIVTASEEDFTFPSQVTDAEKQSMVEKYRYRPFTVHDTFLKNDKVGFTDFSLEEESAGTKILYGIGGLILDVLEKGTTIFLDELDNSLHPRLCRFLIRLFQHPKTNKKNAQLIFVTHEVSLLDKTIFRKDQVWFAEKNKRGESEIFSIKDFDDIRDNSPFDKWYTAGKFGAYPKIKELEFINNYE